MRIDDAIRSFRSECKKVIEQGYTIAEVEADPGEDGTILVCGMTPDGSVVTHVEVDQQDLLMQMLELLFATTADEVRAIHQLKEMHSATRA